jgi:O-antigen/teichoic acid export membrane protein
MEQESQSSSSVTPVQGVQPVEHSSAKFHRRLFGSTFNYGLGSFLPQVVGFLLIPVYTAYLTPDDYGVLDLAATFSALLIVLMRLGVPGAVTRFYYDFLEGPSLRDYVTTISRFLWCSSLFIGLAAFLVFLVAGKAILPGVGTTLVLLVIGTSFLSSNTDLQRRLLQAREQSRYSAILSLAFAGVSIALAVFFVAVLHWGAFGMILAQALAAVAFFIQAQAYLAPELTGKFSRAYAGSSLVYGMGILPGQIMGNFAPIFTRSVLAYVGSLAAVGSLGIASRFTQPLTVVFFAFSTAFQPIYFAARRDDSPRHREVLRQTISNIWVLAVFLCLAATSLAPPAIRIMTPPRFHDASALVPILALGLLGGSVHHLLSPEIYYQKRTWLISLTSGSGVIVNTVSTIILVRPFGAAGAAWATVAGQFATAIILISLTLKLGAIPQPWAKLFRVGAIGGVLGAIHFALHPDNPWMEVLQGIGILTVFLGSLWLVGDESITRLLRAFASMRRSWESAEA